MLRKAFNPGGGGVNDPRDLPEFSHIKKTLEHPDANIGRSVGFYGSDRDI